MVSKNLLNFNDEMKKFHQEINPRLHHLLGCKVIIEKNRKGAEFKVWAPNAKEVRVVGEFNNWNGKKHLMELDSENGIWSLFIPGIKEGDIYKYENISSKWRKISESRSFCFLF